VTNNNASVVEFNSSGMTMSSGKNINLNYQKILYLAESVANYDAVPRIQIANSTIPIVAWRVGETVQRRWYSPKLSNNLSYSTCGPAANVVIVTIDVLVTDKNKLFIGGQFNINANGYNDDQFTMRAGFGSQYMDFVNSMPTGVGFRERTYTFNTVFIANATATKTFYWKIFNESATDTITISSLNWLFTIEEVQS